MKRALVEVSWIQEPEFLVNSERVNRRQTIIIPGDDWNGVVKAVQERFRYENLQSIYLVEWL